MRATFYEMMMRESAKRREAMQRLRDRGWTQQQIAERYHITKQRVSVILRSKKR
ncbi:MAG: helix-turn-helix domain-containing protein [Chloroflexi bacterium]|nr:helix-turn-helix domain-containing protein [Chloroflexota bacterium]